MQKKFVKNIYKPDPGSKDYVPRNDEVPFNIRGLDPFLNSQRSNRKFIGSNQRLDTLDTGRNKKKSQTSLKFLFEDDIAPKFTSKNLDDNENDVSIKAAQEKLEKVSDEYTPSANKPFYSNPIKISDVEMKLNSQLAEFSGQSKPEPISESEIYNPAEPIPSSPSKVRFNAENIK